MCLKLQLGQAAASSASFTTSCSSLRRFQSSAAASSRACAAAAWKDWDPSVEIPKGGRPGGLQQLWWYLSKIEVTRPGQLTKT